MKSLLVFVMLAATMCWFMFSPIYKHVFIVRQAVLQKEVDYLLEIGASGEHGYISRGMVEESKGRLAAVGSSRNWPFMSLSPQTAWLLIILLFPCAGAPESY